MSFMARAMQATSAIVTSSKRCGRRVWSMIVTLAASSLAQIVLYALPSTRIARPSAKPQSKARCRKVADLSDQVMRQDVEERSMIDSGREAQASAIAADALGQLVVALLDAAVE